MIKLDEIQKRILREVADLHEVPEGAFNIRSDGRSVGRQSTANIEIVPKTDVSGLEIHIKPNTRKGFHTSIVQGFSPWKDSSG